MEQDTMLKEILHALELHSKHIDKKFDHINTKFNDIDQRFEHIDKKFDDIDQRFEQMDSKMDNMRADLETRMDKGFDHLGKKIDGIRTDLTETQNTTDFLLSKVAQHEKKLRHYSEQA
ncbi:hypothetical protein [Oceanobacillus sp. CFH 90083]|uniref:hypothetical protein n=1 Tax=Oceanobacillus sp. CFH 90083 TaxID=2592336 RepID=UPI00128AFABF|nr:hypothetical protein [Oceanobacillus sp. CFH 90083]